MKMVLAIALIAVAAAGCSNNNDTGDTSKKAEVKKVARTSDECVPCILIDDSIGKSRSQSFRLNKAQYLRKAGVGYNDIDLVDSFFSQAHNIVNSESNANGLSMYLALDNNNLTIVAVPTMERTIDKKTDTVPIPNKFYKLQFDNIHQLSRLELENNAQWLIPKYLQMAKTYLNPSIHSKIGLGETKSLWYPKEFIEDADTTLQKCSLAKSNLSKITLEWAAYSDKEKPNSLGDNCQTQLTFQFVLYDKNDKPIDLPHPGSLQKKCPKISKLAGADLDTALPCPPNACP